MKLSRTIMCAAVLSSFFSSEIIAKGLGDILTMQNWKNTAYQAICSDGSSETLDNVDIRLNNACPKGDPNAANNILVLHHLENGAYDVTCVDLTRVSATAEEIIESKVCVDADKSMDELLNGQLRTDGNFDLICDDGSSETVSPLDIRLNNVCPKKPIDLGPRSILTMYKNADDNFTVHCGNGPVKTATVEELRALDICTPTIVGPKAGEYIVESGYSSYCRQHFVPTVSGNIVSKVSISFIGQCSGSTYEYSCTDETCRSSNGKWIATLMDETHYEFSRISDGKTAVFKFVTDVKEFTKVATELEKTLGEKR